MHTEFEHNAAGPGATSLWTPPSLGLLLFACQHAGLIPPARSWVMQRLGVRAGMHTRAFALARFLSTLITMREERFAFPGCRSAIASQSVLAPAKALLRLFVNRHSKW